MIYEKKFSIDDLERLFRALGKEQYILRFTDKGVEVEAKTESDPNAWSRFLSLNCNFITRYYEQFPEDFSPNNIQIPVEEASRSNTGEY